MTQECNYNLPSLANINTTDIVKNIIYKSIKQVCRDQNIIVIANFTNEHAFDLLYKGASAKSKDIKLFTQKDGEHAGYILDPSENNILLKDADGRFITSDLDLLMIIAAENSDRTVMPIELGFGDILNYEHKAIAEINRLFEQQMIEVTGNETIKFGPIITHGPFNRCARLSQKCIHFPVALFYPNEPYTDLGEEENRQKSIDILHAKLEKIRKSDYHVEIPALWYKA